MLRIALIATLAFSAATSPALPATCPADVAIDSASLKSVVPNGAIDTVNVSVTVRNRGSAKQPGNTLQSVVIYQSQTKTGTKGIPPLAPGQKYTFVYSFQRSAEAALGSTGLRFHLVVASPGGIECAGPDDTKSLSV